MPICTWACTSIAFSTAICQIILLAYIQGASIVFTKYLDHPQRFAYPAAVQPRLPDASKKVFVFEAVSEVSGAIDDVSALEHFVGRQKEEATYYVSKS
ncbi:hypothetical protein EI94DRAFT_1736555 [Lactarius quietus]|nr:hypothetical protein EI94DRAFT_1736555 [Lactarius quietus]